MIDEDSIVTRNCGYRFALFGLAVAAPLLQACENADYL